jgi:hypothetical protein
MADRYWIATTQQNITDTTYWSTTSGGSGGASVPGTSDKAIFDSNGSGNCYINSSTTVQDLEAQSYSGGFPLASKKRLTVDGGTICRLGTNVTQATVTIIDVSNLYFDMSGGSFTLNGTCTLHTCNYNAVTIGSPSLVTDITIGSGPIYFEGGGYFGRSIFYLPVTLDNTVNSTPLHYVGGSSYFFSNITWNDTGGIYPIVTDPAGGNVNLSNSTTLGPVIIDPDKFANIDASYVYSSASSTFTCEYLHDCYGLYSDNVANGVVETGTNPNSCRDVVTINSATVAKL